MNLKYLLNHIIISSLLFMAVGCTKSRDDLSRNACGLLRAQYATSQELSANDLNLKIIDGSECPLQGSPVVSISILLKSGDVGLCSGTVISSKHILTAAHCYDFDTVGEVITSSVRIEGFDKPIRRVFIHPRVNIPQNDVAIIELQDPTSVNPLPLYMETPINTNDIISIFGYGFDENFNFATLRSGQMRVTGVTSQNIFARFSGSGSNVCFGDSGGPALLSNNAGQVGIVGVTSFATSSGCIEDGFSGFANLQGQEILNFILDIVPGIVVL